MKRGELATCRVRRPVPCRHRKKEKVARRRRKLLGVIGATSTTTEHTQPRPRSPLVFGALFGSPPGSGYPPFARMMDPSCVGDDPDAREEPPEPADEPGDEQGDEQADTAERDR